MVMLCNTEDTVSKTLLQLTRRIPTSWVFMEFEVTSERSQTFVLQRDPPERRIKLVQSCVAKGSSVKPQRLNRQ